MWLALNVSAFALMVLVAVAVSRGRRLEVFTAAVLLTMVSFAFFYHVHEGQIDMIVAALSVSAFLLYPRWQGLAVGRAARRRRRHEGLAGAAGRGDRPVLPRLALRAQGAGVRRRGLRRLARSSWTSRLYREYVVKILPTIAGSDSSPYNQTPLRFWWKYPTAVKIGSALGYAALLFLVWVTGKNSRRLPQAERRVDLRTERNAVLLLAVVLMLLFSPLAWQMAYVWVIVPLALVLTAAPPRGKEWAVLVLAVGAALLSMRMWPYRVLDMTNMIGAAVTALCLMRFYLPLELEKTPSEREKRGRRRQPAEGVASLPAMACVVPCGSIWTSSPASRRPCRTSATASASGCRFVVAAAGWALTLVVLVQGGDYRVVASACVPALPRRGRSGR